MITYWYIHMEFGFCSMVPKTGIFLNGELGSRSRPLPVLFFIIIIFLLPPRRICSHVPIKWGGSYIPNRGAPWPSCFTYLPTLGALLPVIFFANSTANGIPIVARIVPNRCPDAFWLAVYEHLNLSVEHSEYPFSGYWLGGVYKPSVDLFFSAGLKASCHLFHQFTSTKSGQSKCFTNCWC